MKKTIFILLIGAVAASCGPHRYGIKRKTVIPAEDVRVFLDPKLIISGYKDKEKNKVKALKEINNEKTSFEFFIPAGPQEIGIQSRYTRGPYLYQSPEVNISIDGKPGDIVFICTGIKEVGNLSETGGLVDTLIEPSLIYIDKADREAVFRQVDRNLKEIDRKLNLDFFKKKCNALIYGISG